MGDKSGLICPLCQFEGAVTFSRDQRREYYRCRQCLLVFVPPRYRLDPIAEKAEYDLHNNDPADAGYRRFLSRLAEPLLERLTPGSKGLDFGSGPGPTLAPMLRDAGHQVCVYDPFYAPDRATLSDRYQFITATEVVEHLFQPGFELDRLWQLLLPGGTLAVMTKLVLDAQAFSQWHYKNDPTHVSFFSRETWAWWAGARNASLQVIGADVMLLGKPESQDRLA